MRRIASPPAEGSRQTDLRARVRAIAVRGGRAIAPLVLYAGASVLLFAATWADPLHRWVGIGVDPIETMWVMGWYRHALSLGQNPLASDYMNWPVGINMMWNNAPAIGLLAIVLSWFKSIVLVYNVVVTAGPALSAWAAYLAAGRYVERRWLRLICGFLYGFSPFVLAQSLSHPTWSFAVFPPLFVLLLDELFIRQRHSYLRNGILLGLLAAAQTLFVEELFVTEVLAAAIGLVALSVRFPAVVVRSHLKTALPALVVGVALWAALVSGPVAYQFLGPHAIHGEVRGPGFYVTDVANLVLPTDVQLLVPGVARSAQQLYSGNVIEFDSYLSVALIMLMMLAVYRLRRRTDVRVFTTVAVVMGALSLGPSLHFAGQRPFVPLPGLLLLLGPFRNILPSRLMVFVYLTVALVVAIYVDTAWKGTRRRGEVLLTGGLLVAAVALLLPAWPYRSTSAAVPSFFTGGDASRIPVGSVVLVAPLAATGPDVASMLWQVSSGFRYRMPSGYFLQPAPDGTARTGPSPSPLFEAMNSIQTGHQVSSAPAPHRAELLAELRQRNIGTVVVGPMLHRDEMLLYMQALMGRAPERAGGVDVWWEVGGAQR